MYSGLLQSQDVPGGASNGLFCGIVFGLYGSKVWTGFMKE